MGNSASHIFGEYFASYLGVGIRMYSNFANGYTWTRNTKEPIVENFEVKAYYLQDGTTEWKMADYAKQSGGERVVFPVDFKGWVYIPFDSYISTNGPDGTPVQGFFGAEGFARIMILTDFYDSADGLTSEFIIDDFQVVKLGTTEAPDAPTEVPTEAPTEAPATPADTTKPADTAKPADTTAKVETTAAPATEVPAKKGCGSSITVASVAVVMTAVLGSALIIKKNKK